MAQRRKRNKRKISFGELLAGEATKFREAAAKQPAGSTARELLLTGRNKLTKSVAAIEFSNTIEAKNIYGKILSAPAGQPITKAPRPLSKAEQVVSTINVACEDLAKAAFPNDDLPVAVTRYLETLAGAEFYEQYLIEKRCIGAV